VAEIGTPFKNVATASVLELIDTESADIPLYLVIAVNPEKLWKLFPTKVIVVSDDLETDVTVSIVVEL